jgi:hypothetical protein
MEIERVKIGRSPPFSVVYTTIRQLADPCFEALHPFFWGIFRCEFALTWCQKIEIAILPRKEDFLNSRGTASSQKSENYVKTF